MSLRFLGDADGRLHRALRAIRKLVALGFDEQDVIRLMRWHRDRQRRKREDAARSYANPHEREARRRLAQWAIRTMIALGFSESEVADLADVDHSTVAHALDPFGDRAIGQDTALKLKDVVQTAGGERLKLLLPRVAVTVVDTCCAKGHRVDEATRTESAAAVRVALRNALLASPTPSVNLPPGIDAVLAQIGGPSSPLWVFCDRPDQGDTVTVEQRLVHARRREHELDHLLQRSRVERQRLEKLLPAPIDPPPTGGIA